MTDTPEFTPAPIPTEQSLASYDHRTVPGPIEVIGDVRFTAEPSLGGLNDEARARVLSQLSNVPTADRERVEGQLVRKELEDNSYALKVLAGPGEDANDYVREDFCIKREVFDLRREANRITAELEEVVGHTTEYDSDGNPVAMPVFQFAPETRRGREEALQSVQYRIAQLEREAPARLSAAAKRVQDKVAADNAQLSEHAEAKQLADKMLRDERVRTKAEAFAKNRRNTIG